MLCEGTGHAGVGSVFDLSNAAVAKLLNAKVVIVTRGGIGQPIDETVLNHALFKQEGAQVIGVIINKVLPEKLDYITEFAQRGLKRKGLELLGVVPYQPMLSRPTLGAIADELKAEIVAGKPPLTQIVSRVVVGAMGAARARDLLKPGVLLIVPAGFISQMLAFIVFRAFDVIKPPPIRYFDRTLKGGFGVMFDDALAAVDAIEAKAAPSAATAELRGRIALARPDFAAMVTISVLWSPSRSSAQ